ncbi:MAG: hypothetical protein JNK49_09175 [Planctomycetes bacterium]|nr:hypothetical protein [Planctomycetota bacterium]
MMHIHCLGLGSFARLGFGLLVGASALAAQCALQASAVGALPQGNRVACLAVTHEGLFVGGDNTGLAGPINRWTGSAWVPADSGLSGHIAALLPDGTDLIAAGYGVHRWDGVAWQSIGPSFHGSSNCRALARSPSGELAVGNLNGLWFETAVGWSQVASGACRALTRLPNGNLVAAGAISIAGGVNVGAIARFDGTSWHPMGSGHTGQHGFFALTVAANGDLIAGGGMTTIGGHPTNVARWDGAAWHAMGSGTNGIVYALASLPNGDVVAGGLFALAGGVQAPYLARWNGTSWSPLVSGLGAWPGQIAAIACVGSLQTGELIVGGTFSNFSGVLAGHVGMLATPCPAEATEYGSGCTGGGGLNELSSMGRPWLGTTFRARGTGFPPGALAIGVHGFQPISVPLSQLVPQAGPLCLALTTLDVVTAHVPSGGSLTTTLAIPQTLALVGVQVHHQVASAELDASGELAALTSSNGLLLTIGAY